MVQHGRFQHLVHPTLSVPDDQDEDLIYQLGQMLLKLDGGSHQPSILLQIVE